MQSKTEQHPSPVVSNTPGVYATFWSMANFTTVAVVTSAGIISVQSPTKTILMNLLSSNPAFPTLSGGTLSFFRALYAGTTASASAQTIRNIYGIGTKNKANEGAEYLIKEENRIGENQHTKHQVKFGYVAASALGDTIVSNIPENLAQLKKIPGLLPPSFKWYTPYNLRRLMINGFAPKYGSGIVNFTAMLQFESWLAEKLPVPDPVSRHFMAGAFSGSLAAFASYPFSVFKDYMITQTKVNGQGNLITQNSFSLLLKLCNDLLQSPKLSAAAFFSNAAKQLPIRMGLSGIIFSMISGIGETLGPEPLAKVVPERYHPKNSPNFFKSSTPKETPEDNHFTNPCSINPFGP